MKILVICYSKTGNTKKVAEKLAKNLNADFEEIIETKPKKGFIGWIIAAKDAALQKSAPINDLIHKISDYDLVIIGTPIWAWSMSNPIRAFIQKYKQDLKQVAFFATMGGSGDTRAFTQMEELLNLHPIASISFIDKKIKTNDFDTKLVNFAENINKKTPKTKTEPESQ